MAAVSEAIVREFFELHGFLIRQHRKHIAPNRGPQDEDDIDFFVLNPNPRPAERALPFLLGSEDLRSIARAIVVVKGGHTETFSTARLTNTPELFRFVEPKVFQQAARAFGEDGTPLKLLILPALPHEAKAREASITLLKAKGVDGVIPFRTMLATLIAETKSNRNYQKSDLLQIIRILKTYDLIREPQLELFKAGAKKKK
jgi:hypothetical protein